MSNERNRTTGTAERVRVFGDESGDAGFKFDKGSTPYYVVALVVVDNVEGFRDAVNRYRLSLRHPPREFHFYSMNSSQRIEILTFLSRRNAVPFEARALIVNKLAAARTGPPKPNQVYEQYVAMAFDSHRESIADAIVKMDKTNQGGKDVLSRIRRAVNTDRDNPTIHDIQFERSHRSDGVQIADVICGSIWQAYRHKEPKYLEMIGRRVRIIER